MLTKTGILLLALLTLATARQHKLDAVHISEMNHERQLLDEQEEAVAFAELLGESFGAISPAMSDEYRAPIIDQHCMTDSVPFYKTGRSSYPGCFAMCQFIDYCDMFTYKPEGIECCLFHDAEFDWNIKDSPYYCWSVQRPIPEIKATA